MTGPWYVDTNVVLRYLLNDHPTLSATAREFWEGVRNGTPAVLTEGVLMECMYVLTKFYKVPRSVAVASLDGLLRYPGLVQEPRDIFTAALGEFGTGPLDFVDCLLIARERAGLGMVFTFDRGIAKGLEKA